MRKLLVLMILLGTTALAHGQEIIIRKATDRSARKSTQWASSYQPVNKTPVLTPTLVAPVSSGGPIRQASAIIHQAAPVETGAVVGQSCPAGGCGHHHGGCGGHCGHHSCPALSKLWDFVTFRRSSSCCKGYGDCYHGARPLYEYFLGECREGACHDVRHPQPCPPKCATCGWGGTYPSGHRMFVWPTGQGVVGAK